MDQGWWTTSKALGIGLLGALGVVGLGIGASNLTLTPAAGPPGTDYELRVGCAERPTVYEIGLDRTHETLYQPPMVETPGSWSYSTTAYQADVEYDTSCQGENATVRFDTDYPVLRLGPVPTHGPASEPLTRVEGTDCPPGTRAEVTFSIGQKPTVTTAQAVASIDRYGDWSVPLLVTAGTEQLTISASCGSVAYTELVRPAAESTPPTVRTEPPAPARPSVVPSPIPVARPPQPLPGTPSFTG